MPRTKVVNQTGSSIILKEGTAGVFRMMCSNVQPGDSFSIKVDQNATYREYWCAVTPDDDKHVVLSSDDCMEYEEVRIKLKADNTYTWDAVKRRSHKVIHDAGDKQPQAPAPAPTPAPTQTLAPVQVPGGTGGTANPREPGVVGKMWNKVKGLLA